ncbi:MAG: AAA family ATPase [Thermanaerothrix sp.]|uniref:AAA family ATPase n=1 Tax=Thermanaerothrix sp. TaxID=2972675 RepID=UPI003C79C904
MTVSEKVKVLIVDDIPETRETIQRALRLEPAIEVIGTASSGREAVEIAIESRPDVVIMDINMPDMDGIAATEAIRRKVPFCQVVILSVQNDPGYMRRAMLAGARDFLSKPPDIDELIAAVKRAGVMATEEKKVVTGPLVEPYAKTPVWGQQGKIITIYSPKGGSGKTVIATNLAVSLQLEGATTILVDGDLQFGDVGLILNERSRNSLVDLAIRVDDLDPEIVKSVAIKHKESQLDVILAPSQPEMALEITGNHFIKLLQFLKTMYQFVVVDTSSYLSEITQVALENADLIVLIVTQDLTSLKNVNLFLALADASNLPRERILMVLNAYDKRINIDPNRVSKSLKHAIEVVIPLDERIVFNSVLKGRPFLLEDKTTAVSKAISNLSELIKQKTTQAEATPSKSSPVRE